MAEKKMDLMIRITAAGARASAELNRISKDIGAVGKAAGAVGNVARSGFGLVARGVGVALAPLRLAGRAAVGLGAAFAALTTKAVINAAADEKLANRLIAAFGSAEKGKRVFADLESMSMRSAFATDDLAEAMLVLQQRGLASKSALQTVAAAANVTGMDLQSVAMALSGSNTRSLKRMGIDVDEKEGRAIITWTNAMGQAQRAIAATDAEKAKKIMEIMAGKYGTALAPRGFSDVLAMLKNNIGQMFGSLGKPIMQAVTGYFAAVSERLTTLIESGKLEEWGRRIADWLTSAADWVVSRFMVASKVLQTAFEQGPQAMFGLFKAVMISGADIFVTGLVAYLKAATKMFIGLGKMVAAGFLEEVLSMNLPGMGALRGKMAESKWAGMTAEEQKAFKLSAAKDKLTPAQFQARLAASGAEKTFASGLQDVAGALPQAVAALEAAADRAEKRLAEASGKMGIDLDQATALAQVDVETARRAAGARVQYGGWAGALTEGPAPSAAPLATSEMVRLPPAAAPARRGLTQNRLGRGAGSLGGGISTNIQIGQMTIRANASAQMERAVLGAGSRKQMSRWAT